MVAASNHGAPRTLSGTHKRANVKNTARQPRHVVESEEIDHLLQQIKECVPAAGQLSRKDHSFSRFSDLPLSSYTLDGLKRGGFEILTRIQKSSIIHALAGRDILAAAKTGSGKTLAFLIPLLEKIFINKWVPDLGVAAIVITPTRELALQIYEVLRVIGYKHQVTCGLFIGTNGEKKAANAFFKEQQTAMMVNVIVCTPGRLLQHLEQTPDLNTSETSLLVLDEADRLLDMGFKPQLMKILDYLPKPKKFSKELRDVKVDPFRRQTILFSATQTKSVKDLAKLSLIDPEFISVHDKSSSATPKNLAQIYSVFPIEDKLSVLYAFIRSHLKSKIIVFFSSCKQVQFIDAAFRRLQPGMRLIALHGKMKQAKRMNVYYDFIHHNQDDPSTHEQPKRKKDDDEPKKKTWKEKKMKSGPGICLFATDIVARGLDFPNVDWVVQVDCPEDVQTYIHRVGRTARYTFNGKALLLLTENESKGFIPLLHEAKIPCIEKEINKQRLGVASSSSKDRDNTDISFDLTKKLGSEIAKDAELKLLAQKAFKSYVRSVHLQPNKVIFDVSKLPMAALAKSFGLPSTPRIKLIGSGGETARQELRDMKNKSALDYLAEEEIESDEDENDTRSKVPEEKRKTKWERLMNKKQQVKTKIDAEDVFGQDKSDDKKSDDSAAEVEAKSKRITFGEDDNDNEDSSSDDNDGPLVLKRKLDPLGTDGIDAADDITHIDLEFYQSQKARKKLKISKEGVKKGKIKGKRTIFDAETGDATTEFETLVKKSDRETVEMDNQNKFVSETKDQLMENASKDRQQERDRIKAKHRKEKMKLKGRKTATEPDDEEEDDDDDVQDDQSNEYESHIVDGHNELELDNQTALENAALGLID